jgi:hypothetical protein
MRLLEMYPADLENKYLKDNSSLIFEKHWLNEYYGGSLMNPLINFEKDGE